MCELVLLLFTAVAVGRIATADDQSAIIWVSVTILLGFTAMLVPLPYLRMVLVFILVFALMIAYKALSGN